MTMTTSLRHLTHADWVLHYRALQLLKTHLFRDRAPQSVHVIGEPQPIAPSVLVTWHPEPPRRTLLKGGLQYQIYFPGAHGPAQFSIQHWDEHRYSLHANYVDHRCATYTRFSLTRTFDELPACFVECVETMEREFALHPSRSPGAPLIADAQTLPKPRAAVYPCTSILRTLPAEARPD